jgi:2-C-methyl-D-erythritol 4-phosphate cytidylyltransferase
MSTISCWVVLVAGGRGRRLSGPVPKQFLPLAGKPVVAHALDVMISHPAVRGIVLVVPHGYVAYTRREVVGGRGGSKPVMTIAGGRERADSVRSALAVLPAQARHVMIHDGVRPLVDGALIDRLVHSLESHDAVVPVVPSVDTLKEVSSSGWVVRTLDRRRIMAVQTPQAFRREVIERAFRRAGPRASSFTDCSGIVERFGGAVATVAGDRENLKVTTREDLLVAERFLGQRKRTRGVALRRA